MTDPRRSLEAKYRQENRYSSFGPVLQSLRIRGFRGIQDLTVKLDYPVTAISGLNGAGKSTVGQLCLGGYRKPMTLRGFKRFYVRDFFPVSLADPEPFGPQSSVIYTYATNDPAAPQTLTVKRATQEWSGYKRQPERSCFYMGFTIYIPKVEQRDVSVYRGASIQLGICREIPDEVRVRVGRILGQQYDGMHFQQISHGTRSGELGVAARFGSQYSENNMGFGEGRTLYLVNLLENSPERSLFVIEEPETSLHENAQYELGKYLLDVCNRRHHQIILTTHSSTLLQAMPDRARLLLARDADGVAAYPGLSASRVRSILSAGNHRSLTILVEDDFAKLLLTEMIRMIDRDMLKCVEMHAVGNTKSVHSGSVLLQKLGRRSAAVRDADIGPDPANNVFSFPGTQAPEKEVYSCQEVKALISSEFGIDCDNVLAQRNIIDHHKFSEAIADEASTSTDYLCTLAVKTYLISLGSDSIRPLITSLQQLL
jgi:ABC-type cobalamin/Fe3+-siderophores transport system ATPase subunit